MTPRRVGWIRTAAADPSDAAELSRSREDAVHGALLGFVVGDRAAGPAPPDGPGTVGATMLVVAERLAADGALFDGDLARALVAQRARGGRYDEVLSRLLALWDAGMPLRLGASQVAASTVYGGSDLAAAVLLPFALSTTLAADPTQPIRDAAGVLEGDPVGVDGARVLGAAIAAAVGGDDFLRTGQRAAATPVLRRALSDPWAIAPVGDRAWAVVTVPQAIAIAHAASTFSEALDAARRSASRQDSLVACAAALAGARRGGSGLDHGLLAGLGPDLRTRVAALARALASPGESSGTPLRSAPR